ncbi:MAG: PAS domain S-box protein [Thermoleophilia bacterium]|nr:PAS domain S-box protein [Thermoleophilia bacterium]
MYLPIPRLESMARESLEQYRILLQKSPVAMLVSSGTDEKVILINGRFTELFGYTIEDIPDVEHWWPLAYPDETYREEVKKEWNTKAEWAGRNRADIEPLEALVTCRDGSRRYIKFHLSPISDSASNLVTFFDITERRREQKALTESERRYREVIESSRDGFVIVDAGGRFLDCNQAYLSMLGYTLEELKALPDFYAITPSKWHKFEKEEIWDKRLMTSGFSGIYEKEYIRKDGSVFPVELSATVVRDESGELKFLWATARDITALKQAQKALLDSEARYRTLVNMADDAILLTAPDGRIFSANPAACRMFGYSEEEICRLGRAGVVVADEKLEAAMAEREKTGSKNSELTLIRQDGETFPGDVSSVVFQTEDGETRTSMVIRDITERNRAAVALKESEERYRGLFEDSRDMIVITRPEGKFIDINPAGVSLLGYGSRDEILRLDNIATNLYQDPEDREQMLSDMQRSGFLKDYDLKFRSKSGDVLDLSATLTPVLHDDGKIIAIRGILRDMTEHNRLEEQMRHSQKLESIGVLAGGVAHEFNNKLTAILGNIDLALMGLPKDDPAYEDLTVARRSCEQAADVVRQLLVFSRHETMQPIPVNLNSILSESTSMLERIIGEQYDLVTTLGEDIWTISADAMQIGQVIVNLVINARDAMPGGGSVGVKSANISIDRESAAAQPDSRPGEFVRLSVSDAGIGIDADSLQRIFDPFFSTKDVSEGRGMGLSVVYGIIADHKGWIHVDSTPCLGTTVDVFLPAVPSAETIAEADGRGAEDNLGHQERILLVEDEEQVRDIAGQLLRQSGYSVTAAGDAEEARKIFAERQGDFDLVFSDVVLPGESGISLVDHLLEEKPGIKVLLTTGYSEISLNADIHQRGYPMIQKPYPLDALRLKVSGLLR